MVKIDRKLFLKINTLKKINLHKKFTHASSFAS